MIVDNLKTFVDLYEKYITRKTNTQQQKMFDITLINMYNLGKNGKSVITENDLNDIQGVSKIDLFKSLKEAEQRELIKDISSHQGRRWILMQEGIKYTEALLEQIQK
jgi:CTP-dependent riboflavin kinase